MPTFQPHEQRVVDEKADLDAKIERLGGFIDGAAFETLPQPERALLMEQIVLMRDYADVLERRIAGFTP